MQYKSIKLIACLDGPSEPKFQSKQLPNRAFIEVAIKGAEKPTTLVNNNLVTRNIKKLTPSILGRVAGILAPHSLQVGSADGAIGLENTVQL